MSIQIIPLPSKRLLLSVAAAGLLTAGSAHASLLGDSVTGSLWANAGGWGTVTQQFASPATVGAGAEFTGQWTYAPGGTVSEVWDITVDLDATSLTVSAYENSAGSNNLYSYTGTLFGIVLAGLDLGEGITGLSLVSGSSTWSAYSIFTAATSAQGIAIDWHNLNFGSANMPPNGGSWTWEIQYAGATTSPGGGNQAVPEPASAALMLAGLAGTAVFRRRKAA